MVAASNLPYLISHYLWPTCFNHFKSFFCMCKEDNTQQILQEMSNYFHCLHYDNLIDTKRTLITPIIYSLLVTTATALIIQSDSLLLKKSFLLGTKKYTFGNYQKDVHHKKSQQKLPTWRPQLFIVCSTAQSTW